MEVAELFGRTGPVSELVIGRCPHRHWAAYWSPRSYPYCQTSRPLLAHRAFPETTIGSACTSSFSRIARRLLTLRPAHSRGHQIVTVIRRLQTLRHLHACSGRFRLERSPGGACTRWKRAALSRRTWIAGLPDLPGLRCPCFVSGPLQIGGEDRTRRVHSCQQVRV